MRGPQLKDGFTRIANELMEAIYRTKFNGTQFRIIMAVIRNTYGYNKKEHEMSDNFIAKATEIHARQIKRELKKLIEAKVLIVTDEGSYTESRKIKINKYYNEWKIDLVVSKKTSPTKLDSGGELDTSDELDTSVQKDTTPSDELDTTSSVQKDTTSNEQKNSSTPSNSSDINNLNEGGDELDTSDELDTKKRQYKDIYKDITTTAIESSDELDTTPSDELKTLTENILDYYSILTGRPAYMGQDMTTFKFLSEIGARDSDSAIIKEAMSRAKNNWKPKYPGDELRTFNYFMPVIKEVVVLKHEAIALKEERNTNGNTKDGQNRQDDRDSKTQYSKAAKQYGTFL